MHCERWRSSWKRSPRAWQTSGVSLVPAQDAPDTIGMEHIGTVVRLNLSSGFGYVRDEAGEHTWIFVVEHAPSHRVMQQLRVGAKVRFTLDEWHRVSCLVPAQDRR